MLLINISSLVPYICAPCQRPRTNLRTPNYKKVLLLRLLFLLLLLYLPLFHRPTTERTPKELRLNSQPTKSAIS